MERGARQLTPGDVQQSAMLPPIDIPGAVSLSGFPRDRTVRMWIDWAADHGFRGVAIDGATPGMRARELNRSARRDLASLLRRRELDFAGVDLWIPAAHFVSPEHQDRAHAATVGAIEFARELASLCGNRGAVVSVSLPHGEAGASLDGLRERALLCDVTLADHVWPPRAATDGLEIGLDPATALLAGADPAVELPRISDRLGCVRLSDANSAGRATVGEGRLDLEAFRMSIVGVNWRSSVLIDVRGLEDCAAGAVRALALWAGQA